MRTLLFFLTVAIASTAISAEPDKLLKLRTSYEAAVTRATTPLQKTYLQELEKLKTEYTRAAKLEDALAVADEMKRHEKASEASNNLQSQSAPAKSSKKATIEYLTSYRWYFTSVKDSKANGYLITFKSDGTVDQPKPEDKWTWGQKDKDTILLNGAPLNVSVGEMILERPDSKLGSRYLHRDEPISPQ